jgi:hypothetical protein
MVDLGDIGVKALRAPSGLNYVVHMSALLTVALGERSATSPLLKGKMNGMSQGPQKFRKSELGRIIDVANDKFGDAYTIILQRDGTMVLQAGRKQGDPPGGPNEWDDASGQVV